MRRVLRAVLFDVQTSRSGDPNQCGAAPRFRPSGGLGRSCVGATRDGSVRGRPLIIPGIARVDRDALSSQVREENARVRLSRLSALCLRWRVVVRRCSGMMRRAYTRLSAAGICAVMAATPAHAQTLLGSIASVDRQHAVAVEHDYTFLERGKDVKRFVGLGLLVPVPGGAHYELAGVSFPYARPALKTFVERLAAQYHAACGEALVVTSLTRPAVRQPRNASDLSVHPAGMAVDLRYPRNSKCRRWLEKSVPALWPYIWRRFFVIFRWALRRRYVPRHDPRH